MSYFTDTVGKTKVGHFECSDLTASSSVIQAAEIQNAVITNAKMVDDTLKEAKLNGAVITGTTAATIGQLSTHTHGLAATPSFVLITNADATAVKRTASITLAGFNHAGIDETAFMVKCNIASVKFIAYALL